MRNKRRLYESIMKDVSKIIKRRLNESNLNIKKNKNKNTIIVGNVSLILSDDKETNEALEQVADHINISANNGDLVDDYIGAYSNEIGEPYYKLSLWNFYGRDWNDPDAKYGLVVNKRNNTNDIIVLYKRNGKWTGEHIRRRYYGFPDTKEILF